MIPDVFHLLQCTEEGLDSAEAERRLGFVRAEQAGGYKQNPFLQVRMNYA